MDIGPVTWQEVAYARLEAVEADLLLQSQRARLPQQILPARPITEYVEAESFSGPFGFR